MLLVLLDLLSFLTVGLLTIPSWLSFFFQSLTGLGDSFTP
jgi:hypothetical protein